MSQPPGSWDPNAGQQPAPGEGQPGQYGQYGQQPPSYPGPETQGYQNYPQSGPQPAYGGYGQQQPYQPYPQQAYGAPGYGGGQYGAAIEKPGAVTGAAVLGFIQSGLTVISTALLFIGLAGSGSDAPAEMWVVAIVQLAGIVALIFGSVQLMGGLKRSLYLIAVLVQLALSLYWLLRVLIGISGIDVAGMANAVGIWIVIVAVFTLMPLIGLILSLGQSVTRYLAARQARG